MAAKTAPKPPTPREILRALEKKYKINVGNTCNQWMDICSPGALIDGVPAEDGREILFQTSDGVNCGAGVFYTYIDPQGKSHPGTLRFSPIYADSQPLHPAPGTTPVKNGAHDGEVISIIDPKTGEPYKIVAADKRDLSVAPLMKFVPVKEILFSTEYGQIFLKELRY